MLNELQPFAADASGGFFREAFADWVHLLDLLNNPQMRQRWIHETGGHLYQSSSFTRIGNELEPIGEPHFRDMFNELKVSDVYMGEEGEHEASQVVSGALL
ncbi:MAG: hypothetical protein ACKVPX_11680, partial [Myxococcaceae bacterium]